MTQCPIIKEWIIKLGHSQKMEYYPLYSCFQKLFTSLLSGKQQNTKPQRQHDSHKNDKQKNGRKFPYINRVAGDLLFLWCSTFKTSRTEHILPSSYLTQQSSGDTAGPFPLYVCSQLGSQVLLRPQWLLHVDLSAAPSQAQSQKGSFPLPSVPACMVSCELMAFHTLRPPLLLLHSQLL